MTTVTTSLETIAAALIEETQVLLADYLEASGTYADEYFNFVLTRKGWKEEDYCKHFDIVPKWVNTINGEPTSSSFLSWPNSCNTEDVALVNYARDCMYKAAKMRKEYSKIVGMGKTAFIAKELERAEKKYYSSINKLAARVEGKGITVDTMTMSTTKLDQNITTVITDGNVTVRAWTIIASGPIQRPHYRYLVK